MFCCANPLLGRLNSLLVNRFCMPRLCEFVVNVDLEDCADYFRGFLI